MNNFILNPYTYLKSKFYVEGSSLLILICIKLGVKPNTITAIYTLLGLIGGILLCIPNDACNVIGVIIFFSKGIVDWTDGGVAKIINQISKFGGTSEEPNETVLFIAVGGKGKRKSKGSKSTLERRLKLLDQKVDKILFTSNDNTTKEIKSFDKSDFKIK